MKEILNSELLLNITSLNENNEHYKKLVFIYIFFVIDFINKSGNFFVYLTF